MPKDEHCRSAEGRTVRAYRTILADPPWNILQGGRRGAEGHYPLMDEQRATVIRGVIDGLSANAEHLMSVTLETQAIAFMAEVLRE